MTITAEQKEQFRAVCGKYHRMTPDNWLEAVIQVTKGWPADLRTEILTRSILYCSR
jgi:hypothetical protein